jgi:hypothetical protein
MSGVCSPSRSVRPRTTKAAENRGLRGSDLVAQRPADPGRGRGSMMPMMAIAGMSSRTTSVFVERIGSILTDAPLGVKHGARRPR